MGVAVYDLGGRGPVLLLAHAAGFHGHVLGPLAEHLADSFRCVAFDFRGHGDSPLVPGATLEWSGFADDVIEVAGASGDAPVFAFGHSSGGAAVLMAAAKRPDLFESLFCVEPVVWPDPGAARERAEALAAGARRRRASFASRAEAFDNYGAKPPFAWFDEKALQAYVNHGLTDGGVLKCTPEVEAQVYLQGTRTDAFDDLKRVTCPVVVARGTERGALAREIAEEQVRALPSAELVELEGLSHFAPMEDPGAVARAVKRMIPS